MSPISPWVSLLVTAVLCTSIFLLILTVKKIRAELTEVQQALSPEHLNLWLNDALAEWKKDREVPEDVMAIIDQVVSDSDTSTELRSFVLLSALTKEYPVLDGKGSFRERFVIACVESFDGIYEATTEEAHSIRSSPYAAEEPEGEFQ